MAAKGRTCRVLSGCMPVLLVALLIIILYFTAGCGSSGADCGAHGENFGCGLVAGAGSCVCDGGCKVCGSQCESPCPVGFAGASCDVPFDAQGFAEAYTISCSDPARCGTFRRVAARCTSGDWCPGGKWQYSSSTDTSLCNGVPVYQKGGGDGSVLYRREWGGDSRTYWIVGDSSALETCSSSAYLLSAYNYQAGSGPPTVPGNSTGSNSNGWGGTGWVDDDANCDSECGIAVAGEGDV